MKPLTQWVSLLDASFVRVGFLFLVLGLFLPLGAETQPGDVFDGDMILALESPFSKKTEKKLRVLHLHIRWEEGKPVDAWAESFQGYNAVPHQVSISGMDVNASEGKMHVDVTFKPDLWVPGAKGSWDLTFQRLETDGTVYTRTHPYLRTATASELIEGTFQGSFEKEGVSVETQGRLVGNLWPGIGEPRREPIVNDERPRVLFRNQDLPELRAKLETPFGEAIAAELLAAPGPVGPAVLYALTGKEEHALRAAGLTLAEMKDPERQNEHETHQSTFWASRVLRAGVALDLCFDAWEPDFRTEVIDFIHRSSTVYLHSPWRAGSAPITRPGRFLADKIYAGSGAAMLALWGLPGDPPKPPPGTTGGPASALQQRFGNQGKGKSEAARKAYEQKRARWEDLGGANLEYLDTIQRARRIVSACLMSAIGEGGNGGMPYLYDMELAWRTAFGVPITSRPILSQAAANAMISTLWVTEDGTLGPKPLLNQPDILNGAMISRYYAVADLEWRPAIAWYWMRLAGIPSGPLNSPDHARKFAATMQGDPLALFYALRYVPLAPQTRSPSSVLSRTHEDKKSGEFLFRDRWEDGDDIVATFSSRQGAGGNPNWHSSHPIAGTFRIQGLGHVWAHDGHLPRYQFGNFLRYNLVRLTDVHASGWGEAFVTMVDLTDTGASVRMDLSNLYRRHEYVETTKLVQESFKGGLSRERPVTRFVHQYEDLGIEAERIFATDFSGRAGVPGVFVISDRIGGENQKEWQMHVPDLATSDVRIEGNTFHVRKGDATLTGTFVTPAEVKIEKRLGYSSKTFVTIRKAVEYRTYTRDLLVAKGSEGTEGDFLLVMMLWEGETPPKVVVDEKGGLRVRNLGIYVEPDRVRFSELP